MFLSKCDKNLGNRYSKDDDHKVSCFKEKSRKLGFSLLPELSNLWIFTIKSN